MTINAIAQNMAHQCYNTLVAKRLQVSQTHKDPAPVLTLVYEPHDKRGDAITITQRKRVQGHVCATFVSEKLIRCKLV